MLLEELVIVVVVAVGGVFGQLLFGLDANELAVPAFDVILL